MSVPVGLQIALLGSGLSGGGYGLILLSKISNTMGRIDERLGSHDERLQRLEKTVDGAARGTFHSSRVGSRADRMNREAGA